MNIRISKSPTSASPKTLCVMPAAAKVTKKIFANMLENGLIILVVVGYLFIGYLITRLIRKWTNPMNVYLRLLTLSFSYALIFGIGIAGTGGNPGFAFPFPVILTGVLDILYSVPAKILVNGFLIPFVFWWAVIFVILLIKDRLKRNVRAKEVIN